MLHSLGVLLYSPRLESMIRNHQQITSGSVEEVEIRGCSVWGVEMLRREIEKLVLSADGGKPDKIVEANGHQNGDCGSGQEGAYGEDVNNDNDGDRSRADEGQTADAGMTDINAVLIDFFLYDCTKEKEAQGREGEMLPHHRTRSIYY